jgi:outer membrane protein OmpA-like peptidoglycan-associated protein
LDADNKKEEDVKSDTIKLSEKEIFVLSNVQFFTNSDRLLPTSYSDLDRLSLYLLEHPEFNAEISGHTDNRGNDRLNAILSQNRAETVKKYLVDKGINADRLTAIGKGETEPRASNDSKEGMLMNRRVEIKLLNNINSR